MTTSTPGNLDIIFASVTELAAAIRAREVSATEVLEAHLRRIESRNPALNAVVTMDAASARSRARQADDALGRGVVWGPLHGIPFTLKDAFATAGMRTTTGFPPFDHIPTEDSTIAARLNAAGGILIGKTNVARLLADYQTSNPIFGRTNNPWDIQRTPGGSSGGAAAAVATGMTPFEIGTDLSGSIRVPAHFCGIFGFKPTEHRTSTAGIAPAPGPKQAPRTIRIATSVGPMTRTVDDLALIYSLIAGPDPHDTDVPPVPVESVPSLEIKNLRVAVAPTLGGLPTSADMRNVVELLAHTLVDAGAIVDQPALPVVSTDDLQHAGKLIGMIVGAGDPNEKDRANLVAYMEALQRRDASIAAWEQFFDEWDVLLCAPCMTSAFPHCEPGTPLLVDGASVDYWNVSAHTTLFNYSGQPAVVLPCGLDGAGLPMGVQLVGRRWSDSRLLGIAKAVSPLSGEFRSPP